MEYESPVGGGAWGGAGGGGGGRGGAAKEEFFRPCRNNPQLYHKMKATAVDEKGP